MAIKTSEILGRAGDLVAKEGGWGKGAHSIFDDECYCAVEAIYRVTGENSLMLEYLSARELLIRVIGTSYITRWNDAPERTQEEVVAAFREAERIALALNE